MNLTQPDNPSLAEPQPAYACAVLDAFDRLEDRKKIILTGRLLGPLETLQELGDKVMLTRERVRQLEGLARAELAKLACTDEDVYEACHRLLGLDLPVTDAAAHQAGFPSLTVRQPCSSSTC